MRLRRLNLTRYGRFTDFTLDFGEASVGGPDLHLVYGLNEAGKSTALSGFLDLLFGIEERSRYGFLHSYPAMEVGAVLEFAGARHELRRVKQRVGSLRDASGQPIGEGLLAGALGGLTRDAYRTMFSLDDETLEQGGDAILDSKGDLGELLFSASAGLAGLGKALAAVGSEADGLFRKRASSTEIARLKQRLAALKSDRDGIDTQASAYATLVADHDRAEQAYHQASAEHAQLKVRLDELGGLTRAAPLLAQHAELGGELDELGDLPRPPDHWAAELPALIGSDATLKTELSGLDAGIARLREDRDALAVDHTLLRLGDRVEALSACSVRHAAAEADLPRRSAALAENHLRLAESARAITGSEGGADADALVVGAATLGRLRGLIERWSGIEARVAATTTELEAAAQDEAHAQAERHRLEATQPALDVGRKAALRSAVGGVKGSDLLARRRVAAAAADAKARSMAEALRLVPWTRGHEDLETVAAPSHRLLQDWRDALAGQALRREALHRERHDLKMEQAELQARLDAAQTGAGLIGDEDAATLRSRRDHAWTLHREQSDARSAAAFESLMRASDAMSDARLAAADRLAELRALQRERDLLDAKAAREDGMLADVEAEAADLDSRITQACPSALLEAAPKSLAERLASVEAWVIRRDQALAAAAEHRSALGELQALDAETDREATRLGDALRALRVAPGGLDLAALLQAADDLLAKEASDEQARAAADRQVRDSGRALDARRKAAGSAEQAEQAWRAEWTAALAGTWFQDRGDDRSVVAAIVDALSGLPARLAARDELARRVSSMEADQDGFLALLEGLRRELGEEAGEEAPGTAAAALIERRRAAVEAQARRRTLSDELDGLERDRAGLVGEIAVHDVRKADLFAFFGAQDLKEVAACLTRCERRDRLEAEREGLASRILQETGLATLPAAEARLTGPDADGRAEALAECARRIEELDGRLRSLFAARSSAADKLAAVGGDDAVARIETQRRVVMLEIEDAAVRFLRLRTGAMLAEGALQAYRETHRGAMMSRASEAFTVITRGRYSGLATRPEKDRETLIGLAREGGSKLATEMSKGARFQLYLALRLAGYEGFGETRQPVPFVADDIMETFDEPRSAEVLSLFGRLAKKGQIIYLTHHKHMCDLAKAVVPQVVVHELPS